MAKYLTKRTFVLRLLLPAAAACAVVAALVRLLAGPVLGRGYDMLVERRPDPPFAREILLIETGGGERVVSPEVAGHLLLALTEFGASKLVLMSPVLGVRGGTRAAAPELSFHFEEEFKTINANIRNLFDGIRLGSVEPDEARRYVDEVLRLTGQSRARLLKSAEQSMESGEIRMEKALAVFGAVYVPKDIQAAHISEAPGLGMHTTGYSYVAPDHDGKIRRIKLYIPGDKPQEHVVWSALKNTGIGEKDFTPMLDATGSLIFEAPPHAAYRTIPVSLFMEYEDLEKTLYKLLASDLGLAGYSGILPDRYPAFIYGRMQDALEQLLEKNHSKQKEPWLQLRTAYYTALEEFFTADTRRNIELSFEKLAEDEKLGESGREKIAELRDTELQKFSIAFDVYHELDAVRKTLELSLYNSFCIMGDTGDAEANADMQENPVMTCALLANTLFTESAITVVDRRDVIVRSGVAALLVILLMAALRLPASICMLALAPVLAYLGFSYGFIVSGIWLDPIIPTAAVCAAAAVSLLCACILRTNMAAKIRHAYAPVISAHNLRRLVWTQHPLPKKNKTVKTAVLSICNPALNSSEKKTCEELGAAHELFRKNARDACVKEGAVIIACGGNMVVAAFGSPLERLAAKKRELVPAWEESLSERAARLLDSLQTKNPDWRFGADIGECSFNWTALTGYAAVGLPVTRAQLLSRVCRRYGAHSLVTEDFREKIDATLVRKTKSGRHKKTEYYEFIGRKS